MSTAFITLQMPIFKLDLSITLKTVKGVLEWTVTTTRLPKPLPMVTTSNLNPAAQAGLTEEQIENPQTGREYYLDSLAAILQENIGQPVTCEFLIGTNNIVRRDGVLLFRRRKFCHLVSAQRRPLRCM